MKWDGVRQGESPFCQGDTFSKSGLIENLYDDFNIIAVIRHDDAVFYAIRSLILLNFKPYKEFSKKVIGCFYEVSKAP